jgi:hypothetical protein
MGYLMLAAGLAACASCLVYLLREKRKQPPAASFRETLASAAAPAEATLYYELKGQVEEGMAALKKRQAMIESALLRLENRMQNGAGCPYHLPGCFPAPAETDDGAGRLRAEVRSLHGHGATITKIASCTGLGKGEVELILSLKQ